MGAAPIPDDLDGDQMRKLMIAISRYRRKRLLRFIAAAIAEDIWQERQKRSRAMLKKTFDPHQLHRYVDYTRMSDKKQNDRSPEQQANKIKRVIKNMRLAWKHVSSYQDKARKGAFIRKRKAFNRMLTDIRSARLKVDVIAVDTTERFARAEETPIIRKELYDKYGVVIPEMELDPKFKTAPRKMARARWHEDNAELVYRTSKSMRMKDMVKHFSKSDVTIRKAIAHARNVLGLK